MMFSKHCIASAVVVVLASGTDGWAAAPTGEFAKRSANAKPAPLALLWASALAAPVRAELDSRADGAAPAYRPDIAGDSINAQDVTAPFELRWADGIGVGLRQGAIRSKVKSGGASAVERQERRRVLTLLDEGRNAQAEAWLERWRDNFPEDAQVAGALGLTRLRQGRHADAESLFVQALALDADNANKWRSLVGTARYWKLLKEASLERERKNFDLAFEKVRAAIALEPTNVEGLALRAGLLADTGDALLAERHYLEGLQIEAGNGSAIRGLAGLLILQKRWLEATALLDRQGAASREINGSFTYLRVGLLRDQADERALQGKREQAIELLQQALAMAPDNPWVRYDLAVLLRDIDPLRSQHVIEEGLRLAAQDSDMHYASALYFAKFDDPNAALRSLSRIPGDAMNESIRRLQRRMTIQSAIARASELDNLGQKDAASAALGASQTAAGDDPDFLYSLANAWMSRGESERSLDMMRQALGRSTQGALPLQLRFASLLNRAQRDDELGKLLQLLSGQQALSTDEGEELAGLKFQLNLRSAYMELKAGHHDKALDYVNMLEQSAPQDSRVLLLRGNLAANRRDFDGAMAYFKQARSAELAGSQRISGPTQADGDISGLEQRRQARVSLGFENRSKPGTPGVSELRVIEVPFAAQIPIGYQGHALVRVENTSLSSGVLDVNDTYALSRFGKVQQSSPTNLPLDRPGEASGTSLTLGYEDDQWRADIGTTPLGFPVQDIVGGMRWSGSVADLGYSLEVSRRPVSGSLLSFAGATDPVTGEVWGGVRSSGASVRFQYDGPSMDASISAEYRLLQGKNVLNNSYVGLRPELGWNLISLPDMKLSAGVAYTYWKFDEDLSYYTFGHGGYYSPQSYHAIALPWKWSGYRGQWSYALEGSVSASWTRTKEMPFYPTDTALQAATGNPMHVGGDSNGTGFTMGAAWEYQFSPGMFVGARVEVGRAAYYAPNSAFVYVRYLLDRNESGPSWPPEAPRSSRSY